MAGLRHLRIVLQTVLNIRTDYAYRSIFAARTPDGLQVTDMNREYESNKDNFICMSNYNTSWAGTLYEGDQSR